MNEFVPCHEGSSLSVPRGLAGIHMEMMRDFGMVDYRPFRPMKHWLFTGKSPDIPGQEHPDGPAGLPAFKLLCGDNWHVTADECRTALDAYSDRRTQVPGGVNRWGDWIAFLHECAGLDGFRVRRALTTSAPSASARR